MPEKLIDYLASKPDLETLRTAVKTVDDLRNSHRDAIKTIVEKIQLDETLRFGEDRGLVNCFFANQVEILDLWHRIQQVVEIESPVHFDEVARRITNAVGVSKIGNRIRNALKAATRDATHSRSIQRKGEFLYWTEQCQVIVRDRSELPSTSKKLELIAPEEIEVAIKNVISNALGMERTELPQEVCRLFGFKAVRVSENMRQGEIHLLPFYR